MFWRIRYVDINKVPIQFQYSLNIGMQISYKKKAEYH